MKVGGGGGGGVPGSDKCPKINIAYKRSVYFDDTHMNFFFLHTAVLQILKSSSLYKD